MTHKWLAAFSPIVLVLVLWCLSDEPVGTDVIMGQELIDRHALETAELLEDRRARQALFADAMLRNDPEEATKILYGLLPITIEEARESAQMCCEHIGELKRKSYGARARGDMALANAYWAEIDKLTRGLVDDAGS